MGNPVSLQIYPSKILKESCIVVSVFDDDLRFEADQLISLMYFQNGKGLAANQAGRTTRMCVVELNPASPPLVMVNPTYLSSIDMKRSVSKEGCLSFPGLEAKVDRYNSITVNYQDLTGKTIEEKYYGQEAFTIQHEVDHLDGLTFLDVVGPVQRDILLRKWKKTLKKISLYKKAMNIK
jgi:peptide deformylase